MTFVLDAHCHTVSSGHAYSTVTECAGEAARKGLALLAITDHGPTMEGAPSRFHFGNLCGIPRTVNGVEILGGVELNILDTTGAVDLEEKLLAKLDIAIASLHPPIIRYDTGVDYTEPIIAVMENPLVDILGHLGDPRYPFDAVRVVEASRRTHTLIELNNASFSPNSTRAGGEEIVRELARCCAAHGVPMVLGSDAHFHTDVGDFSYLETIITELAIPEELILNTSVEKFKAALARKRPRERK